MAGDNKSFGEHLKALRNEKKEFDESFSVRGLAEKIGLSATYLSKIERGELPASNETIYLLAKALGVSPDSLFARAGKLEPELQKKITSNESPVEMAAFLRTASGLSQDRLEMYKRMIDAAEGNAPAESSGGNDAKKV